MQSGLRTWAAVCLLLCLTHTAFAGDPFLERAKREMEQGSPTGQKQDQEDRSASSPEEDSPSDARTKLQEQRDARARAKAAEARAKLGPALKKADRLIDSQQYHEAYLLLKQAQKKVRPIADPDIQYRLAKLALLDNKPEKALELLAPVIPAPNGSGMIDPRGLGKDELHAVSHLLIVAGQAHNMLAVQDSISAHSKLNKGTPSRKTPNTFFGINVDNASDAKQQANPFVLPELVDYLEGLDFLGVPIDAATEKPALTTKAQEHVDQSLRLFDQLAGHAQGEQIEAAWRCGRSLALLGRYSDALDAFAFAQRHLKSAYSSDIPEYLRLIAKSLAEDKKKVIYLHDVTRYGLEFLLYREAQKHRLAGRYEKAVSGYQRCINSAQDTMTRLLVAKLSTDFNADTSEGQKKIAVDESPYTAASRLYQALCLIEIGQSKEAVTRLEAFVDEDPATKLPTQEEIAAQQAALLEDQDILDSPGLYRGQALLELGRIALEHELDLDRANTYFSRLDHWITQARTDNVNWSFNQTLPGIKLAAKKKTNGPQTEYLPANAWSRPRNAQVNPGMLLNRRTTPWYLDNLQERAIGLKGFIALIDGKPDEAVSIWRQIVLHDSKIKLERASGLANSFRRLTRAAGNGYFIAYPAELKLYGERTRTLVLLCDFYYCTEDFAHARKLAMQMLNGRYGNLTAAQADYLHFSIANATHRQEWSPGKHNTGGSLRHIRAILDSYEGTLTESRARLAAFNLTRDAKDPELRSWGKKCAIELIKSAGESNNFSCKARINLAIDYYHQGELKKASTLLDGMPPNIKFYSAYAKLLANTLELQNQD